MKSWRESDLCAILLQIEEAESIQGRCSWKWLVVWLHASPSKPSSVKTTGIADDKSSMFKSWSCKPLVHWMFEAYPWFIEPPWGTREDFQCRWGGFSTQWPRQKRTHENRNEVTPILDWWFWKGKHNRSGMLQCERPASTPYIVFTGQQLQYNSTCGCPLGAQYSVSANGWMTGSIFLDWMRSLFLSFLPQDHPPVLLVLDGHTSYEVCCLARENCVHLLKLPPHLTHLLQPLDLSVFKPMKST